MKVGQSQLCVCAREAGDFIAKILLTLEIKTSTLNHLDDFSHYPVIFKKAETRYLCLYYM
jgi:hypothetical protein